MSRAGSTISYFQVEKLLLWNPGLLTTVQCFGTNVGRGRGGYRKNWPASYTPCVKKTLCDTRLCKGVCNGCGPRPLLQIPYFGEHPHTIHIYIYIHTMVIESSSLAAAQFFDSIAPRLLLLLNFSLPVVDGIFRAAHQRFDLRPLVFLSSGSSSAQEPRKLPRSFPCTPRATVGICTYTHICIYIYMYTYVCVCVRVHIDIYIHMQILTYAYTHIHIHAYTRIYTYTQHTYIYYITLHYSTLHYITLHYITLHYITLHYITLHYTTSHHIT